MRDWINIIDEWTENKRDKSINSYLKNFFEKTFQNTLIPEKSWFGFPPSKNSLGLFFGRVMLVGIFQDTIEIIIDDDISDKIGFPTRVVGSSKSNGELLFWITTSSSNLKKLIENELIWKHYKVASLKVDSYSNISWERKDWLNGKFRLSEIYNPNKRIELTNEEYELTFENEIRNSQLDSKEKRIERLKKANKTAQQTISTSKIYIRNSDVVAEVLDRANGICEYCENQAPFKRDFDGLGFLEVHHLIPLSENGLDTVENCVALCPNCHRHAHYGKKTFELNKIKKKRHTNGYK
ncbi:HNH endonuclease [Mariniflexile maritimum]|jgi:5-methylcytosine-specific restriction endonuclease McrA|uniref:HNH endonuclease n=1 Tax=Mariniflexile maritimum TaxID=2682493 RepID=UPI0012F6BC90|nr:HNH endonuclease [Mariniflexile maritimum]